MFNQVRFDTELQFLEFLRQQPPVDQVDWRSAVASGFPSLYLLLWNRTLKLISPPMRMVP